MTDYARLLQVLTHAGVEFIVVGGVAAVKRAAGRSKDLDAIAELEALLEERDL
jgi:hypothetical protein